MSEQKLDPQIVVAVQQAALDARDPNLRNRLNAAAAYFAALTRRDEREREAWSIVQEVAEVGAGYSLIDGDCMLHGGCSPEWVGPISDEGHWEHHTECPVTRARILLGGGENDG